MPYPSISFRTELDPVVRKELDALSVQHEEFLSKEHNPDGTHGDITADTISVGTSGRTTDISEIGDLTVGDHFGVRNDLGWIENVAATGFPAQLLLSADPTFQPRIKFVDSGTDDGWQIGNNITAADRSFDLYNLTTDFTAIHVTEAGDVSLPISLHVHADLAGGPWGGGSSYTAVSLNGSLATGAYNLLSKAGDTNLYINRPSGKQITFGENNNQSDLIIKTGGQIQLNTFYTSAGVLVVDASGNVTRSTSITTDVTGNLTGTASGNTVGTGVGAGSFTTADLKTVSYNADGLITSVV